MNENKALTAFDFQGHDLQIIMHNGEPWLIGKEVCDVLGYANSRDALSRLSEKQKDYVGIPDAIGRIRETTIISEGGIYKLAFRSNKPEAEAFTDLVADTILPTIRKTGSYSVSAMQPASNITQLETIVTSLLEEVAQLRLLIKPKARPVSLIKESARARVFRCHQKLEAKKNRPITARDISRYCSKIPVELIRRYLEEYVQQGVLQAVPTIHTIKYSSIKID